MADAQTLRLEIKVGTDGLVEGLKVATAGVDQAAQQMNLAMRGVGHGAREAHGPVGGLTDMLKDYRREISQERRMSMIFARDIASMGFASKSAAAEITGLVSAFAVGGGIGVAIEAIKMIVTHFNESGSAIKKFTAEALQSVKDLQDRVDKYLLSLKGETEAQKIQRETLAPLEKKAIAQKADLVAKTDEEAAAQNKLARAEIGGSAAMIAAAKGMLQLKVAQRKEAEHLLSITQQQIHTSSAQIKPALVAEAAEAAKKQREEDENAELAHQIRMLQYKAQALDGEAKLRAEFAVKVAQIRAREDTTEKQDEREIAAERLVLLKKINDAREQKRLEDEQRHIKHLNRIIKAEYEAAEALKKYFHEREQEKLKQWEDMQHRMERAAESAAHMAQQIGENFGSAFGGIVTGTESVAKAITNMAKEAVRILIDLAIKSITASAYKAGADAASSQAGIPIFGPVLAIAAMGAMITAVLGLIGNLPSAAGGFDVPRDTLASLHAGEMVLPAKYAEVVRQAAERGDVSGGATHIHFHTSGTIDRTWWDRNEGELVRKLRDAGRKGRI